MKIVSFALWGDAPKYTIGALRNAELAASVYPSWICRFYCGATVPSAIVATLERHAHVEVVRMPEPGDWRAMFWRFHPASEADVEVMLSRDTDSRLGERERAAVEAWLASDRDFHVMRDHPMHGVPILGGMWGVRGELLHDMRELIAAYRPHSHYQVDQRFLETVVAPRVRGHWLEHDGYFAGRPFPTRRSGRGFVGQPFDEHDHPLIEGPDKLGEWVAWMRHRRVGPPLLVRRVRRGARRARSRCVGRWVVSPLLGPRDRTRIGPSSSSGIRTSSAGSPRAARATSCSPWCSPQHLAALASSRPAVAPHDGCGIWRIGVDVWWASRSAARP